jgi:hypothetical protein
MNHSASFSSILLDYQLRERDTGEKNKNVNTHQNKADVVEKDLPIALHREDVVLKPTPAPYRRFTPNTIYGISFLLIVTVVGYAVVDARVRLRKLEDIVRYMYYKQLQ